MSLMPALARPGINVMIAKINNDIRYIKQKLLKRRYDYRYRSCLQVELSRSYAQYSRAIGPNAAILPPTGNNAQKCRIFIFLTNFSSKFCVQNFLRETLSYGLPRKIFWKVSVRGKTSKKCAPVKIAIYFTAPSINSINNDIVVLT